MVEHYRNPLTAFAAACDLPKDGERWLVVAIGLGDRATWHYVYPACAERSFEMLAALAKVVKPEGFDCFVRHKPTRLEALPPVSHTCAVCGAGIQQHC